MRFRVEIRQEDVSVKMWTLAELIRYLKALIKMWTPIVFTLSDGSEIKIDRY